MSQKPVVFTMDPAALSSDTTPSDRFVFSSYFKPITLAQGPRDADAADVEVIKGMLQSEMGWLFLDRTRIRPAGLVLGEHLQSLSLAPGEELIVEQKTFTKRETTFEEQSEQERQLDLEMSSTLSTELSEGLDRETNRSEQTQFQIRGSAGMGASIPLEGVTVSGEVKVEPSYSETITEADRQAAKRSLKDTSSSSSKVASKYRAMHKTTFRVSSEDRFEAGAKRVLRNANQFTPIDLHYFKLLQSLELTLERYGARLCWAPQVRDPGADVARRIELERATIVQRAIAGVQVPPRPPEPPRPTTPPTQAYSDQVEADQWGVSGDMRADYPLEIHIPNGYVWDGNTDELQRLSSAWGRPSDNMGWHVTGPGSEKGDKLLVTIHVGCRPWIGGPKVFMRAGANFVKGPAGEDAAYQQAIGQWRAEIARWEVEAERLRADARAQALERADAWERTLLASLNPLAEVMAQVVNQRLHGPLSDEAWEVGFWSHVFDWKRAGVTLAPGYWANRPARDQLRTADYFLNASSAQLYLPVKPGLEHLALRWIVGRLGGNGRELPTSRRFFSAPATCSGGRGRIDVFAIDADGDLLQQSYDGGWSSWSSLGRPEGRRLTSDPAAVASEKNRIDVVVRGDDLALWQKTWTPETGWQPWSSIGGPVAGAPALFVLPGPARFDVLAVHPNGQLAHRISENGHWHDWTSRGQPPGQRLTGDVAVTSWRDADGDAVDAFVRAADGQLWQLQYRPSAGWGWYAYGVDAVQPAGASWAPGRIDLFAYAPGQRLIHRSWDGQWVAEDLPDPPGRRLLSKVTAVSANVGHIDVFAVGDDRQVWRLRYERDAGWRGWELALEPATEEALKRLVDELRKYRTDHFDDADETNVQNGQLEDKIIALGRWTERLPTDGTHLEVVQAMTTSRDGEGTAQLERATTLAAAQARSEEQDTELKKKAAARLGSKAEDTITYTVAISTYNEPDVNGTGR